MISDELGFSITLGAYSEIQTYLSSPRGEGAGRGGPGQWMGTCEASDIC